MRGLTGAGIAASAGAIWFLSGGENEAQRNDLWQKFVPSPAPKDIKALFRATAEWLRSNGYPHMDVIDAYVSRVNGSDLVLDDKLPPIMAKSFYQDSGRTVIFMNPGQVSEYLRRVQRSGSQSVFVNMFAGKLVREAWGLKAMQVDYKEGGKMLALYNSLAGELNGLDGPGQANFFLARRDQIRSMTAHLFAYEMFEMTKVNEFLVWAESKGIYSVGEAEKNIDKGGADFANVFREKASTEKDDRGREGLLTNEIIKAGNIYVTTKRTAINQQNAMTVETWFMYLQLQKTLYIATNGTQGMNPQLVADLYLGLAALNASNTQGIVTDLLGPVSSKLDSILAKAPSGARLSADQMSRGSFIKLLTGFVLAPFVRVSARSVDEIALLTRLSAERNGESVQYATLTDADALSREALRQGRSNAAPGPLASTLRDQVAHIGLINTSTDKGDTLIYWGKNGQPSTYFISDDVVRMTHYFSYGDLNTYHRVTIDRATLEITFQTQARDDEGPVVLTPENAEEYMNALSIFKKDLDEFQRIVIEWAAKGIRPNKYGEWLLPIRRYVNVLGPEAVLAVGPTGDRAWRQAVWGWERQDDTADEGYRRDLLVVVNASDPGSLTTNRILSGTSAFGKDAEIMSGGVRFVDRGGALVIGTNSRQTDSGRFTKKLSDLFTPSLIVVPAEESGYVNIDSPATLDVAALFGLRPGPLPTYISGSASGPQIRGADPYGLRPTYPFHNISSLLIEGYRSDILGPRAAKPATSRIAVEGLFYKDAGAVSELPITVSGLLEQIGPNVPSQGYQYISRNSDWQGGVSERLVLFGPSSNYQPETYPLGTYSADEDPDVLHANREIVRSSDGKVVAIASDRRTAAAGSPFVASTIKVVGAPVVSASDRLGEIVSHDRLPDTDTPFYVVGYPENAFGEDGLSVKVRMPGSSAVQTVKFPLGARLSILGDFLRGRQTQAAVSTAPIVKSPDLAALDRELLAYGLYFKDGWLAATPESLYVMRQMGTEYLDSIYLAPQEKALLLLPAQELYNRLPNVTIKGGFDRKRKIAEGTSSEGMYAGIVVGRDGKELPAAIKVVEFLDSEEVRWHYVMSLKLKRMPEFYGIVRDDAGRVAGFAMMPSIGEDVLSGFNEVNPADFEKIATMNTEYGIQGPFSIFKTGTNRLIQIDAGNYKERLFDSVYWTRESGSIFAPGSDAAIVNLAQDPLTVALEQSVVQRPAIRSNVLVFQRASATVPSAPLSDTVRRSVVLLSGTYGARLSVVSINGASEAERLAGDTDTTGLVSQGVSTAGKAIVGKLFTFISERYDQNFGFSIRRDSASDGSPRYMARIYGLGEQSLGDILTRAPLFEIDVTARVLEMRASAQGLTTQTPVLTPEMVSRIRVALAEAIEIGRQEKAAVSTQRAIASIMEREASQQVPQSDRTFSAAAITHLLDTESFVAAGSPAQAVEALQDFMVPQVARLITEGSVLRGNKDSITFLGGFAQGLEGLEKAFTFDATRKYVYYTSQAEHAEQRLAAQIEAKLRSQNADNGLTESEIHAWAVAVAAQFSIVVMPPVQSGASYQVGSLRASLVTGQIVALTQKLGSLSDRIRSFLSTNIPAFKMQYSDASQFAQKFGYLNDYMHGVKDGFRDWQNLAVKLVPININSFVAAAAEALQAIGAAA